MTADRIILTSGGTEANNLAIRGRASKESGGLIVSAIEHQVSLEPLKGGQKPEHEESAFCPSILWALFPWSNCESGSIYMTNESSRLLSRSCLPITRRSRSTVIEIARACRERNIAFTLTPFNSRQNALVVFIARSRCDDVSAHKFHGPVGIGALVAKHNFDFDPQLFGGISAARRTTRTEAVVLAIGFATALEIARVDVATRESKMKQLRIRLEQLLLESTRPPVIIGAGAERLPHTISLAYPASIDKLCRWHSIEAGSPAVPALRARVVQAPLTRVASHAVASTGDRRSRSTELVARNDHGRSRT